MNRSNTEKLSIDSGPRDVAAAGALRVKILRCGLVVGRSDNLNLTITFYVAGDTLHRWHQAACRLRALGYIPAKPWRNWVNHEADFKRGEEHERQNVA
jgi:hypothetical protein